MGKALSFFFFSLYFARLFFLFYFDMKKKKKKKTFYTQRVEGRERERMVTMGDRTASGPSL